MVQMMRAPNDFQTYLSPFCKLPKPWGKIISDLPQMAALPPVYRRPFAFLVFACSSAFNPTQVLI